MRCSHLPISALVVTACLLLAGCIDRAVAVPFPSPGSPQVPPAATAPPPGAAGAKAYPPPDTTKPVVTWGGKAAIPFIYSAADPSGPGHRVYFLGIWDLDKGTVSLPGNPLFAVDDACDKISWDGGDRFGFLGGAVTQLDPRVRIEQVPSLGSGPGSFLATPSGSDAVFAVYSYGPEKAVLRVTNHPLAGEIELRPELAPGTSLRAAVGLEVAQDEIRALLETTRQDRDAKSGEIDFVYGILSASYRADRPANKVSWRMVNPQVPAYEVGAVVTPPEFREELRKADPEFVAGLPGGAEVAPDLSYGYGDYRIVCVYYLPYLPGEPLGDHSVFHAFAFRDGSLAGRIDCIDGKVSVYKDGEKTLDVDLPDGAGGSFRFPQTVEPLSGPVPGVKAFGPDDFDAIWKTARYADLFNETLRTDGWTAEQMANVLMERFTGDPGGFIRALGMAAPKEVEHAGYLLAYNAGYRSLDEYRRSIAGLKVEFPEGKEAEVLRTLLVQSGDNLFDARTVKVGDVIKGLRVASLSEITPQPGDEDQYSVSVEFSGEVTLTGTYYHDTEEQVAPLGGPVQVRFMPDDESAARLPRIRGDNRTSSFVFDDYNEASKAFGPQGSTGKATVVIDNYRINRFYSCEGVNRARLVRVVEK